LGGIEAGFAPEALRHRDQRLAGNVLDKSRGDCRDDGSVTFTAYDSRREYARPLVAGTVEVQVAENFATVVLEVGSKPGPL
jgi:hypothetical protein